MRFELEQGVAVVVVEVVVVVVVVEEDWENLLRLAQRNCEHLELLVVVVVVVMAPLHLQQNQPVLIF